jgi:hypothetical protein
MSDEHAYGAMPPMFTSVRLDFQNKEEFRQGFIIEPRRRGFTDIKDIVMEWGDTTYEKTWAEFLAFMGVPEEEIEKALEFKQEDLMVGCQGCSGGCNTEEDCC